MRMTYITHTRYPTEKAHGWQVAQVCQALSRLGHHVTLLHPTVRNDVADDAWSYYGLQPSFVIQEIKHVDAQASHLIPGPLRFAVAMRIYARTLRRYFESHSADLLYVRSPLLLGTLLRTGLPVILELHALPQHRRARFARLCNRCRLVVCLTSFMRDALLKEGASPDRVIVEADGVDPDRFRHLPSPSDAKKHWQLTTPAPIIGYVGSLATKDTVEKGVDELLQALAILKHQSIPAFGWIVGGPEDWKDRYKKRAGQLGLTDQDVHFEGQITTQDVPSAIAACDVCVYPAPRSTDPFFLRDTSPLKLFEYLAAGRPVVCADIPPVHDVVDETSVRFVAPGDGSDLAKGIGDVLSHSKAAQARVKAGLEIVKTHSWEERMRRIVQKLGH